MFSMSSQNTFGKVRLNDKVESRVRGDLYARFGGECLETYHCNKWKGAGCLAYGQMASLKVQLSRLATKESFWVFSGNDFNLKVSDKKDPSYLIIANNPKTQSMNSALNALIINRLTRLVNTKGNYPTSIIVDECPTLYFYQLATLLSTARSNKVSICLGLQELPQLEEQYGKATAKTITSIIGNTLSGQAKAPETLDWLQKLFGKVKQVKEGVTIRRNETTINMNEQMDFVIPASKISSSSNPQLSSSASFLRLNVLSSLN